MHANRFEALRDDIDNEEEQEALNQLKHETELNSYYNHLKHGTHILDTQPQNDVMQYVLFFVFDLIRISHF